MSYPKLGNKTDKTAIYLEWRPITFEIFTGAAGPLDYCILIARKPRGSEEDLTDNYVILANSTGSLARFVTKNLKINTGELLLFKIVPFNKYGMGINSTEVDITFSEPSAPFYSPKKGNFSNSTHIHIIWDALMKY